MIHATESKKFPLFAIAVGVLLAGCGVGQEPVDGTTDQTATGSEELRKWDPCMAVRCAAGTHCVSKGQTAACVANAQTCKADADCRLFANYCDGCGCQALSSSNPDPFCSGTTVACFAYPCMNKTAVCQGGTCKLQ